MALEPRRRRIVALGALPACAAGIVTPLNHYLRNKPHGGAMIAGVLALICVPLVFAMRESILLRRERSYSRP